MKGPPGAQIGLHKHYGSVTLYTIKGAPAEMPVQVVVGLTALS